MDGTFRDALDACRDAEGIDCDLGRELRCRGHKLRDE
eukprot:CAMPEP_0202041344 /NCGR_PEP_ID=MMETSP0962-20130828/23753_1 /ASSEMBLY_ACC=CAM_ASM_000488 /TAXON_ID=4773 /ORGANISM="Schizochytrium aggregatum, Strain ATCC28209" /LENGTH=36 /DNA_ID= /DNA_START= /DNA_END= /DNA_ORIENTATION=